MLRSEMDARTWMKFEINNCFVVGFSKTLFEAGRIFRSEQFYQQNERMKKGRAKTHLFSKSNLDLSLKNGKNEKKEEGDCGTRCSK